MATTKFIAKYEGQTFTRGSQTRTYTHAVVARRTDLDVLFVARWSSREDLATKAVSQVTGGLVEFIAIVPVYVEGQEPVEEPKEEAVESTEYRDEWFTLRYTADGADFRTDVDEAAMASAVANADDTSVERGFSDTSEEWYEVALATYHRMAAELANERQVEADLAALDADVEAPEVTLSDAQEMTLRTMAAAPGGEMDAYNGQKGFRTASVARLERDGLIELMGTKLNEDESAYIWYHRHKVTPAGYAWLADKDNKGESVETTVERVRPKGIRFEDRACVKCGGVQAYNPCTRCRGKGRQYTKRGAEAFVAYEALLMARLGVPASDIRLGDAVRLTPTGPWSTAVGSAAPSSVKGYQVIPCIDGNLQVRDGDSVMRHNPRACVEIMYAIADRYDGATLDMPKEAKVEESKVEETTERPYLDANPRFLKGDRVEYVGSAKAMDGYRGTVAGQGARQRTFGVDWDHGTHTEVAQGALKLLRPGPEVSTSREVEVKSVEEEAEELAEAKLRDLTDREVDELYMDHPGTAEVTRLRKGAGSMVVWRMNNGSMGGCHGLRCVECEATSDEDNIQPEHRDGCKVPVALAQADRLEREFKILGEEMDRRESRTAQVPTLTEAQAKALVDTYLGAEYVEHGFRNLQRGTSGHMHSGAGHSKASMTKLASLGLVTMEEHITSAVRVPTERHWTAKLTDKGRSLIHWVNHLWTGPEGERFELEMTAVKGGIALLVASDYEEDPDGEPEVTKTWFATTPEALGFISTTGEEFRADGWTHNATTR
jgi:hypothetical protein